jgi:nucleoid DNA-binding protein
MAFPEMYFSAKRKEVTMSDYTDKLTDTIKKHLVGVLKSSGLPNTRETLEVLAQVWFEKKEMFEAQIRALDMMELESFTADDPRGALLLTYSGSLVSLGPLARGGRRAEYASIQLRTDVPHLALKESSRLESDLKIDHDVNFIEGPVKSTSSLLKITACAADVPAEEQEKRIREATIFLTNGFMKINRTIAPPGTDVPEQFTLKAMVTYLARKNVLSQKQTRQLLDDYHTMLESGILLGQRVPLGKIGRLFLKKRPPQKARVGINPATGEKITLKARPEEPAPRMAFSGAMKEKSRQVELK